MFRHALVPLLAFLFLQNIHAQDSTIDLVNSSFEDRPMPGQLNGKMPEGWFDCGFLGESAPDVHPEPSGGSFQVTQRPLHGQSYLGLVVRDNETWERFGQALARPMKAGVSYDFNIHLARSPVYESVSRKTQGLVNFTTPCVLRIWGGTQRCSREQLLAESEPVTQSDWKAYDFVLTPETDFDFIVFEAFYKTPTPFPYNGNLLIDFASPLTPTASEANPAEKAAPKLDGSALKTSGIFFGENFEITILPNVDSNGVRQDSFAQIAMDAVLFRANEIQNSIKSDLKKLYEKAEAGKGIVPDDHLWFILNFAKQTRKRTQGTFDITMGELQKLWKENGAKKRKPTPREIKALRQSSGMDYVKIDPDKGTARLLLPRLPMSIEALARGYTLDCLADVLFDLGHKKFFIQTSNMAVAGEVPNGSKKWQHERPVFLNGKKMTVKTPLWNSAIATTQPESELFKKYGDTFYDLVDPVTGEVIRHRSIVTVEAPSAMQAYGWAMALTINYDEGFLDWLETQDTQVWYSEP